MSYARSRHVIRARDRPRTRCPALPQALLHREVLVVPCTTKRTADALRLIDPSAAGLRMETWLRPHPVKLGHNAFIERLGRVTVEDLDRALSVVGT
jgi:hypothetical protein